MQDRARALSRSRSITSAHAPERRGYANGTKPKRIDTPGGTVNVQVPKTAGHDGEPIYPQSLERERVQSEPSCVCRPNVIKGGPPGVEAVMREFGSRACLRRRSAAPQSCWMMSCRLEPTDRSRIKYLILDRPDTEKYSPQRHVRDVARGLGHRIDRMSPPGAGRDGGLSELRSTGGPFLESLVARGMRGSTSSSPMTTAASRRPARRLGRMHMQRLPIPLAENAHTRQRRDRKRSADAGIDLKRDSQQPDTAPAESSQLRDRAPNCAAQRKTSLSLAVFTYQHTATALRRQTLWTAYPSSRSSTAPQLLG